MICTVLAALSVALYCLIAIGREESVLAVAQVDVPPFSTGMAVLVAERGMDKAGLVGEEIVFDPEDFARALNLSSFLSVTVIALPPVTDGELRLASARVQAGQRIPRGDIDRLVFVPAGEGISHSSFTFRVGESGYDIPCELHLLRERNAAPTVADQAPVRGICEHMSYRGQLTLTDPEGDCVRAVLVTPPAHGSLLWLDAGKGIYLYRPTAGFAGVDSFSVIAADQWGNTSAQTKITVRVGICAVEQ